MEIDGTVHMDASTGEISTENHDDSTKQKLPAAEHDRMIFTGVDFYQDRGNCVGDGG